MWTWHQGSGALHHDGVAVGRGYSGHGRGVNNPALQSAARVGPVPRGRWRITERYDSASVGRYALRLEAVDARPGDDRHQATGRGAFRIHGDNVKGDQSASRGCIILPRNIREAIWTSSDHDLEVVA